MLPFFWCLKLCPCGWISDEFFELFTDSLKVWCILVAVPLCVHFLHSRQPNTRRFLYSIYFFLLSFPVHMVLSVFFLISHSPALGLWVITYSCMQKMFNMVLVTICISEH